MASNGNAVVQSAVPTTPENVSHAVSLGWHVAELYYIHDLDPSMQSIKNDALPFRFELPNSIKAVWLAEQISAEVLAAPDAGQLKARVTSGVEAVKGATNSGQATTERIRGSCRDLHFAILEMLAVTDSRLAKAYELGIALQELSNKPTLASGEGIKRAFRDTFSKITVDRTNDWLVDLKSLLPAHVSYAIVQVLKDWVKVVQDSSTNWQQAQIALSRQGRLWRALITGEKSAKDLLGAKDYVTAVGKVGRRLLDTLQNYLVWIIPSLLIFGAGIVVISELHTRDSSVKSVATLAWLAAGLGLSLKTVGTILGSGLKDVEGWLWESELDESIATVSASLPPPVKHRYPKRGEVGRLDLSQRDWNQPAPARTTSAPGITELAS